MTRGSRSPAPAPGRSSFAGQPETPPRRWTARRRMAETLEDGRLIIVDADQHTCYSYGDPCANDLIDDYLINLNPPPEVTEC